MKQSNVVSVIALGLIAGGLCAMKPSNPILLRLKEKRMACALIHRKKTGKAVIARHAVRKVAPSSRAHKKKKVVPACAVFNEAYGWCGSVITIRNKD